MRMAMSEMELRIKNDLKELKHVEQFVADFAAMHQYPGKLTYQINLALEELITNVISYGYDDADTHSIALSLEQQAGELRAEMQDDGRPFNPLTAPAPELDVPLEERTVGGLGIHLVKNLFDSLSYERTQDRNCTILKKDISSFRAS